MIREDTIAAIATAPGAGGVSIVRISGGEAERILMAVFRPANARALPLQSHLMTYGRVLDGGETVDECMAVLMRSPRSYTREDVAELQLHGGGATAQRVLALCLREGARLAEPGEFTRRAFLNGRIDLSQAEAVMALISAQGEQARQAAVRQLSGGASAFVREAADALYAVQAGVAACTDYPEEVSEEEAAADLLPRVTALIDRLSAACDERAARLLERGLRVVLCGRPNVGKSSLLNALLGEDRAIVTAVPGTTRDTVDGVLTLGGAVIHLTDTAGLHDTEDPVERLGVARSRKALAEADRVLLVLDASAPLTAEDRALLTQVGHQADAVLLNKADLPEVLAAEDVGVDKRPVLSVSAAQPETLTPLKALLTEWAAVSDQLAITQPRHIDAVRRAVEHLRQARSAMAAGEPIDLTAIDLQAAQLCLGEITGDQVEERLLDAVFSRFCVGK